MPIQFLSRKSNQPDCIQQKKRESHTSCQRYCSICWRHRVSQKILFSQK